MGETIGQHEGRSTAGGSGSDSQDRPRNERCDHVEIGPLVTQTGISPTRNSDIFGCRDRDGRLEPPAGYVGRSCVAVDETGGVSLVVLELKEGDPTPSSMWSSGGGVWSKIHYLCEWSEFTALSRRCAEAIEAAGIQWSPVTALGLAGLAAQLAADWPHPEEDFNIDRFHEAVKKVAPFCLARPHDRTWTFDDNGEREYEELHIEDAPAPVDSADPVGGRGGEGV